MGWAPGVLLAALAAVQAQITEPGICPFSTPVADWNEEQFVSEPWYEIRAFAVPGLHDALPSPGCTRWHFSKSDDGLGLHARLAYRGSSGDGDGVHAFAQYTASQKYPRFNLTFHNLAGTVAAPRSVDMKLIATNYDDFALLWGCFEPNLFERKVVSWVLSRRPSLSDGAQDALKNLFRRHDIRAEKFVDTDHDAQTCGAAAAAAPFVLPFPGVLEDVLGDSETDVAFAAYRNGQGADSSPAVRQAAQQASSLSAEHPGDADEADSDSVSWNYVGGDWTLLGTHGALVALLLALAGVTVVASLLAFRALMQRLQHGGLGLGLRSGAKSVLPVHRQDILVATLGSGVDYSRFGGLGQGLVQTRKHAAGDLGPRI